jgi:hypothetical protein
MNQLITSKPPGNGWMTPQRPAAQNAGQYLGVRSNRPRTISQTFTAISTPTQITPLTNYSTVNSISTAATTQMVQIFTVPTSSTNSVTMGSGYFTLDVDTFHELMLQRRVVRQIDSGVKNEQEIFAFELPKNNNYLLPDGAHLYVDENGNYRIEDAEAKIVYKGCTVREFNPYINASDLLEYFIDDAQKTGAEALEILKLPIEAFINWLILQAAKKDGDSLEDLPSFESVLTKPALCLSCGKGLPIEWVRAGINFCSSEHMELKLSELSHMDTNDCIHVPSPELTWNG